jgi:glycosyltransferase involved in cell wall biosynthesis
MRIGFDARWYNESGVGTYVVELLRALTEFSPELDLVIFEDRNKPVPIRRGFRTTSVPVRSSRFSLASHFELRALCRSHQVDLFHSPYQYGVQLLLPCPLVVTMHDLIPFLFRTRSWPKQIAAIPFVKLGYFAAALRADHIIADSANTARDVEKVLRVSPARITPIYLASSDAYCPYGKRDSNNSEEVEYLSAKYGVHSPYVVAGSAGNWRAKNLETALRALALGQESAGIHFQTVIYGPQKGLDVIRNRSGSFGLNIVPLGYVSVHDLAALFRNADVFITASLYEGFGLPILEAMACGCPGVTSNGGSLAEVAGDGAQVFDPMDVKGMSQAIANLLCSPEQRRLWGSRALARAKCFSWRKAAEETIAVYRKVLGIEQNEKAKLVGSDDAQSTSLQKSA